MKDHSRFSEYLKSDDALNALLESLNESVIISISDREGNILCVNSAFELAFGYSEKILIGQNYRILNSGKHSKEFFKKLWETINLKMKWSGEICNVNKNGEEMWFQTTIFPILNQDDDINYFIAIRHDISEIKIQDEEIWQQLQFQATINSLSTNIILKTDLSGVISYCNKAFQQLMEVDSAEIIFTRTPVDFILIDDIEQQKTELESKYKRKLETATDVLFFKSKSLLKNESEWRLISKSGAIYIIKLNINYYYDKDQNPVGFILIGQDISKQKEVEHSLMHAKIEAQNTLRLKSEFMSRLSHEIKTPLNGILGMVELLEHTELNSEQKDCTDTIYKSSQRLLSMINKSLEFNKVESDKYDINEMRFYLSKTLSSLYDIYFPLLKDKEIEFKIINKISHDYFLADEKRIYQTLNYFLENAFKFTKEGSVSLTVEKEDTQYLFTVRDTGIGIAENDERNIFSPYVYEKSHRIDDHNGLGLSLCIANKIVQKMNGEIGFKTSLGHGSMFWFKIPMVELDQSAKIDEIENIKIDPTSLKVLVVEDDQINQRLLKKMLNKLNIFPEVVSNGLEALEIQKLEQFNLIFMDINMPILDGIEATRLMRMKQDTYGRPYIIAVTANSVTGDEESCLNQGMDDYISKPIKKEHLINAISKITSSSKKQDEVKVKALSSKYYIEKMLQDYIGDEEILSEFLVRFLLAIDPFIKTLESGILEDDFDLIKIESNRFKDLITTLRHQELKNVLESFENYGSKKEHRNIMPMLHDLNDMLDIIKTDLKELRLKEGS